MEPYNSYLNKLFNTNRKQFAGYTNIHWLGNHQATTIADPAQKEKVEQLIKNEPEEIPTDDLLFRIWQMEYIEKGLRSY